MNEHAWKEQAARIAVEARETVNARFPEWSPTETMSGYATAVAREAVQQAIAAERGEPVAVPHVVYDMKMPPYHYQKPYTGSGGSISVPSAPPTEAQIRADERERCAKVADEHRCKPDSPVHRGTDNTARMIAAAIRSLKESDNGAG